MKISFTLEILPAKHKNKTPHRSKRSKEKLIKEQLKKEIMNALIEELSLSSDCPF